MRACVCVDGDGGGDGGGRSVVGGCRVGAFQVGRARGQGAGMHAGASPLRIFRRLAQAVGVAQSQRFCDRAAWQSCLCLDDEGGHGVEARGVEDEPHRKHV